ncbi:MAG: YHS domain-containing (seleno)protein [Bacteroidota bacterium]
MKQIGLAIMLFVALSSKVTAQESLRKTHFNLKSQVAIQGYDPVAYFNLGHAEKGKEHLAVFYQGVNYYFSNNANKELFKKQPAKYEPAYGGWCAYAMGASAEKVSIDPATFKIVDGRLFLFYNKFFNNTLKDWNKKQAELEAAADANWSKLFH